MDYIEGQTLASYLRTTSRVGKFPPLEDIVYLFTTIGQAIDYAHHQGMLHRDIKPANILLDRRSMGATSAPQSMGEPILSDFGIVKLLGSSSATLSGGWMGTPLYIAPEQVRGQPGNERSDIYSLAVILYELCTGKVPFRGNSAHQIMMQQLNESPTPPVLINPHIPPVLSAVILRGLAKEPETRFASAVELTSALVEALNISSLVGLNSQARRSEPGDHDVREGGPSGGPEPSPQVISRSNPSLPVVASSTHQFSRAYGGEGGNPVTPSNESPGSLPTVRRVNMSFPVPSMRRLKKWHIVLLSVLVIVLIGASLDAYFVFSQKKIVTSLQTNHRSVLGHAFFVSSGQLNEKSNQGITDELQIDLYNLPEPAPGNSYYGWLQPDKGMNMVPSILLGKLPVSNGEMHFLYTGDQRHRNLLAIMSRLLITEEDTNALPSIPSPDTGTWRYYAEFPQSSTPNASNDMSNMSDLSVLAHLRHLLAEAPELKSIGLSGGLDTWLFRNTQKVLEWAGSARDDWQTRDVGQIHRHLVRILQYLDGISLSQRDTFGEPALVSRTIAKIGLLNIDPAQRESSYLYLIDFHLNAMIQSKGLTPNQRQVSIQIDRGVKNVQIWLEQMRQDAKQLVKASAQQLLQPSSLSILDDMTNQALNAFVGRINPATGKIQDGVLQVHFNNQLLATFDMTSYKA